MSETVGWVSFWVTFGLADAALAKKGRSLSAVTRKVCCTDTPAGRTAFTLGLLAGGFILQRHICCPAIKEVFT